MNPYGELSMAAVVALLILREVKGMVATRNGNGQCKVDLAVSPILAMQTRLLEQIATHQQRQTELMVEMVTIQKSQACKV